MLGFRFLLAAEVKLRFRQLIVCQKWFFLDDFVLD
jgi:hypothetical protein